MHPYLVQENLLEFCREKGIHITAYSPTGESFVMVPMVGYRRDPGRALVRGDPVIKELAVKYNVTPTQVILGWGLARGVSLAVQSRSEAHRKEILNVRRADPEDIVLTAASSAPRDRTGGCEEDRSSRQETVGGFVVGQVWDDDRVVYGTLGLGTFEAGGETWPSK